MNSNLLSDWLGYINSNRPDEGEFGLERLQKIFTKIVKKPLAKKSIIIGGTNGKGTTVEYLKNLFLDTNYKVGVYTSPHLINFNERIQINGKNIDDERIIEAFKEIESIKEESRLTYFDYATLAAFYIFSQEQLDFVILEIGVGGKYDPVNLINADISIVTNIEMDHEKWLGNSLEEIGSQKAAIFKQGKVAILGSEVMPKSITSKAHEVCSSVYQLGEGFIIQPLKGSWDYSFNGKDLNLKGLSNLSLNSESAACALTAFKLLSKRDANYKEVITGTYLKGRCEVVDNFVLDVSHNPASVKNLIIFLQNNYKNQKFNAIFSSMSDKDIVSIIQEISDLISEWSVCAIDDDRFNITNQELLIKDLTKKQVTVYDSVYSAVKKGYDEGTPQVVFGSFITVSEAYKAIDKIKNNSSEKN
jgi:dihydrofolate synthase/folylpolyglutamate synthase